MLYNALEDAAICRLRDEYSFRNRPAWGFIVKALNAIKPVLETSKKMYTVSMVRNRYIRLNPGNKAKKNKCAVCGLKKRGHTCIRKADEYKLNTIYDLCDMFLKTCTSRRDVQSKINDAISKLTQSEHDRRDGDEHLLSASKEEYAVSDYSDDTMSESEDAKSDLLHGQQDLTEYGKCAMQKEDENDVLRDPLFQEYLEILSVPQEVRGNVIDIID